MKQLMMGAELKALAIVGSEEFARQLAHLATLCGYRVAGYFDDFKPVGLNNGLQILGSLDAITHCYEQKIFDEIIIGIGYKHLAFRAQVYARLQTEAIPLATLVHPSCVVDQSAQLAPGCVLYAGCILDKGVRLAGNVLVNLGCILAHDTAIGAHTFVSPGATLAGFVIVGERCFIGVNATVIDNIAITDDTTIGGGAVVTQSIGEAGVYVGNPAKKIR